MVALDAEHGDGQVVIKGLLPYFDPADEGQVGAAMVRLHREAAILAAVHHRTVPRLVDEFAEGACPYVVMEYLSGENLLGGLTRTDPATGAVSHGMGCTPSAARASPVIGSRTYQAARRPASTAPLATRRPSSTAASPSRAPMSTHWQRRCW